MYHTGIDPFTAQEVFITKNLRDRRPQHALLQFFKPDNYFVVREALIQAGRQDLIGGGCDCLIPARPPREAIKARRQRANEAARGDHYQTVANPANVACRTGATGLAGSRRSGGRGGRATDRRRENGVGGTRSEVARSLSASWVGHQSRRPAMTGDCPWMQT
jgi:hypothetical protein